MDFFSTDFPFRVEEGVSLASYSTFDIGGKASLFAIVTSSEQMQQALLICYKKKIPYCILGKGSNLLFDSKGFCGIVLLNKIDYCHRQENYFRVGAGTSFPKLGHLTARLGLSGLEFAAGVPATVGGALFMNAGANGQDMSMVVTSAKYIHENGMVSDFTRNEMQFGYRRTLFHDLRGAIVEVQFALSPDVGARLRQKDLLINRHKSQPCQEPSCGCTFRNPSSFSAGALIDQCGLKGMRQGGAEVSCKHGNFIVNKGGATSADVFALIKKVKEQVYEKKGILLEEEIRYLPFVENE